MVTITSDGWMVIKEDDGAEAIVRIETICLIDGDEEVFTIRFVSGEDYTFDVAGGFAEVSRELTGHMIAPTSGETYGRVPV